MRELIDARPISGLRLAQAWEQLAERIERHRLTYKLDADRGGPLGPEPARIAREHRPVYEQQRQQLASAIERYRQARGLPKHQQTREITIDRGRDHGLEREL